MSQSASLPNIPQNEDRGDAVAAQLVFTERGPEKPRAYAYPPPDGGPAYRGETTSRQVLIENARPFAGALSLDVEGIAAVRQRSAVRDFWDEAQTLALGHPETAELVKAVTGASRVVVFDHTLRRHIDGAADRDPTAPRQPVVRAHVDQTVRSGPQRVRDIMGDEAEAVLRRRAAIINVWRPIAHPALDWPLAVGDARSIALEDLIAQDLIFPHRTGETYGVAYNPHQRWLHIPDLEPNEALLIKCWDSDPTVARFAPHTAFESPATPPGAPARQSIEFRTIAFFD
jgi:hypothetical protein